MARSFLSKYGRQSSNQTGKLPCTCGQYRNAEVHLLECCHQGIPRETDLAVAIVHMVLEGEAHHLRPPIIEVLDQGQVIDKISHHHHPLISGLEDHHQGPEVALLLL
jgi:hypothetical protein